MSQHLHGNAQTAAKDHQIREEFRNTDYEVVEIQFQELYDKTLMLDHIRRVARAVVGKKKAKEIVATDDWFEDANEGTNDIQQLPKEASSPRSPHCK